VGIAEYSRKASRPADSSRRIRLIKSVPRYCHCVCRLSLWGFGFAGLAHRRSKIIIRKKKKRKKRKKVHRKNKESSGKSKTGNAINQRLLSHIPWHSTFPFEMYTWVP
jgi:hypothetical protein